MDEIPVPAPRSKRPVPSPRRKDENEEKEKSKGSLQHSSSIRRKLKSMSENVQEGTKFMGSKIEKSVKDMLRKNSSSVSSDEKAVERLRRPLSLQPPDVFKEISFSSPLERKTRSLSPSCSDSFDGGYDELQVRSQSLGEPEALYAEIHKICLRAQSDDDASSSNAPESDEVYEEICTKHEPVLYEEVSFPNHSSREPTQNQLPHSYENWSLKIPPKPENSHNESEIYENLVADTSIEPREIISFSATEPSEESYQNWNILPDKNTFPPDVSVFNEVIQEFDPLFDPKVESNSGSNSDQYLLSIPDIDIPIPPERQDSLQTDSSTEEEVERVATNNDLPGVGEQNTFHRWSRRVLKKVTDGTKRPKKEGSIRLVHSIRGGMGSILKEQLLVKSTPIERTSKKWCLLASGKLGFMPDSSDQPKEWISLEKVLSIQVSPDKLNFEGEDLHFFELSIKGRSRPLVLGFDSSPSLRIWTQAILRGMVSYFPAEIASSYSRAGWCFLKEGINRSWKHAWIVLDKRSLFYCRDRGRLKDIDLRKAKLVELKTDWNEIFDDLIERGPCVLVSTTDKTLYMYFDNQKEAKEWKHVIKSAAVKNGRNLEDQQMTKDECPVIVDKCINFIYAHGLMSSGIYRKSGSSSKISLLLSEFRKDSWAVQLTPQEYSEHDVACALKRFFKELPQPLLVHTLHAYFCSTSGLSTLEGKIESYRRGLEQLPPVNYVTAKRIFGHLHAVQELSEKNLMTVDNLSAIWGPTLMQSENGEVTNLRSECDAISDLILLYEKVFDVDTEELAREKRIRDVVKKTLSFTNSIQKPSGDFKIGIYIGSKAGDCINVTVTPRCTAGEICLQLWQKTTFETHELCLMEVLLNGSLTRPLHHTENVLDIVTRWGNWEPSDRKDNYLILSPNTTYRELSHLLTLRGSKTGELKYADRKSKSFKNFGFEFKNSKLVQFKEKNCLNKITEWKIEEIIWYMGHEPKRNPHSRWAITFINKHQTPKRTKEEPYFGHTLAGGSREDYLGWMASFLLSLYAPSDLFPPRNLV